MVDSRVVLLAEMVQGKPEALKPVAQLNSPFGYAYPEAVRTLELAPGEERLVLEQLADGGYLTRQFFDKIHSCPSCGYYSLNFRETCHTCNSSNVEVSDMIHHLKCAYTAPEKEFRSGVNLVCPKCARTLRHIGVDYEKPSSSYICNHCQDIFLDPDISCTCLNCGSITAVENLHIATLSIYRLTPSGTLAASRGEIHDHPSGGGLIATQYGIYSVSYFRERLTGELSRWYRHKHPFAVLMVDITPREGSSDLTGAALANLSRDVAQVVKELLRDCDIASHYSDHKFICLLPDTPPQGSAIVVGRMRARLQEVVTRSCGGKIGILMSRIDSREERLNVDEMIELAIQGLSPDTGSGPIPAWNPQQTRQAAPQAASQPRPAAPAEPAQTPPLHPGPVARPAQPARQQPRQAAPDQWQQFAPDAGSEEPFNPSQWPADDQPPRPYAPPSEPRYRGPEEPGSRDEKDSLY